jgi:hypothetical protein
LEYTNGAVEGEPRMVDRDAFLEQAEQLWFQSLEQETSAWIERTGTDGKTLFPARPLGMSECGIMLRLDAPVDLDEQIDLMLGHLNGPLRLTLTCRVARLRREWDDSWIAACKFIPELPLAVMNLILSKGLANRRQSPRCAVTGSGTAKWQSQPEQFDVEFIDISQGGCCIRCRQAGQTGQEIEFTVESQGCPVTVQATARWCMGMEDGSLIVGCEFLGRADYLNLNAALENNDAETESAGSQAEG